MLRLTRKKRETILIGLDIEVIVLDVEGGVVTLGIKAPREVLVLRKEVAERGEYQLSKHCRNCGGAGCASCDSSKK